MGFNQNIVAKTLLHTYTQLIVLKTRFPSHVLLTKERILILSLMARMLQHKQGSKCLLYYTHIYNPKNVMIFGFLASRALQ